MVSTTYSGKGGYSSGAEQYTLDIYTHTCKIKTKLPRPFVRLCLCFNLRYQHTAMVCTPKSSGGHLGIYIPLWMAYALQLGGCSAVPLLCGG